MLNRNRGLIWFFLLLSGRINRAQYILGCALNVIFVAALLVLVNAIGAVDALPAVMLPVAGVVIWSIFALGFKRWQDLGFSRLAFFLIPFIPLVGMLIFILCCFRAGEVGDNRYGPPPDPLMFAFNESASREHGLAAGLVSSCAAVAAAVFALAGALLWALEADLPMVIGAGCFAIAFGFLWIAAPVSEAARRGEVRLRLADLALKMLGWCLTVTGVHVMLDGRVETIVGGGVIVILAVLVLARRDGLPRLKLAGALFPAWMWAPTAAGWLLTLTVLCFVCGPLRALPIVVLGAGLASFVLLSASWGLGEQQARVDVSRPPPCGLDFESVETLILGDGLRLGVADPELFRHHMSLDHLKGVTLELKRHESETPRRWSLSFSDAKADSKKVEVFDLHPDNEPLLIWALCRLCVHEGWVLRSPWGSFRREDLGLAGLRDAVQMAGDHVLAEVDSGGPLDCLVEDRWPQRVRYAFEAPVDARRQIGLLREKILCAGWAAALGGWTLPLAPFIFRRLSALPVAPALSLDAEGVTAGSLRCAWDEVQWLTALPIHSGPVLLVTARGAVALPVSEVYEARLRFGRHLMSRVGAWLHDPEREPEPPRLVEAVVGEDRSAPPLWRVTSLAWSALCVSMVGGGALLMTYFWWVWWALSDADMTLSQSYFPLGLFSGASMSPPGLGGLPLVGVALMVLGSLGLMTIPSRPSLSGWTPLRAVALCVAQLAALGLLTLPGIGASLAGHYLGPYQLSNVDMKRVNLAGVRWDSRLLKGASSKIIDSELKGANLSGADFGWAVFDKSDLEGADLSGAFLVGGSFVRARLDLAGLAAADLRDANLTRASLRRCNLMGAQLMKADLRKADLRGADLRWADLSNADLRGAKLKGARFDGAVMSLVSCSKKDKRCRKLASD